MSRARSQVPLPRPMDPLQTTRMNDGVLYAAEWPCCHDPLRLSPSRPICCRPASITYRWRRQPPLLGRASTTRSPLWPSVRSTHTARARPTVRLLHLRLDPAHGAPAQHARTARSHNRSDQARHSSASELGCEGVGGERPRALKQTPSIRATLSPQSSATRHIVSIQRDARPARVVALLLIARPPCASRPVPTSRTHETRRAPTIP